MFLETGQRPTRKKPSSKERAESSSKPPASSSKHAVSPEHGWYLPIKTAVEFVLASTLLVLTSPVVALAAILVKLTSPGPAIYCQTRVGKNGRLFTIFKLRTMRHNCEAETGPQWATTNDSRVTPIGRFLRATHIDEFTQLWNVLLGDMSLVGPRPERPEFVKELRDSISNYENRLAIRPGITGLAQVCLPPDTDHSSVRRKLMYDLYYTRHVSLWLDLRLLFCTLFASLGIPDRAVRLIHRTLLIPSPDRIEELYDIVHAKRPPLAEWHQHDPISPALTPTRSASEGF